MFSGNRTRLSMMTVAGICSFLAFFPGLVFVGTGISVLWHGPPTSCCFHTLSPQSPTSFWPFEPVLLPFSDQPLRRIPRSGCARPGGSAPRSWPSGRTTPRPTFLRFGSPIPHIASFPDNSPRAHPFSCRQCPRTPSPVSFQNAS